MGEKHSSWDEIYKSGMTDIQLSKCLSLFAPRFKEIDEMILLAEQLEVSDIAALKRKYGSAKKEIERAVNCVDFTDIVDCQLPGGNLRDLVQNIAHNWELGLQKQYPTRRFELEVIDFSGDGAWGIILSQLK